MGFLDNIKINKMGSNAHNAHVQANDFYRRGRLSDAKKKFEEALNLYDEAYKAGNRKTDIMMSYSVLLMRYGMFEKARELMKEISSLNPKMSEETHFELRMNYSICLWRLGILDKAIETCRYAGKTRKNGSYYASLGTFLVENAGKTGVIEDFEDARVLLEQAMEYDDEDAATLDNYGEYYRQLMLRESDTEEAARLRKTSKEYFERARKIKPGQITTLYALARYEIEDGNTARARELLDKAIMHSSSRICPISLEDLQKMKAQL